MSRLWQCPKCKREFAKKSQAHSCVSFPLENHFKGKKVAKDLFKDLKNKIEACVGPLKIESLPCCIHLVSNYTFGAVWALKDKIRIDFRIDYQVQSKRFWKVIKISTNRYLYYLDVKDKSEIDQEILSWIKEAYLLNKKS